MPNTDPYWISILPAPIRNRLVGRVNLHAIVHNSGWLLLDKFARIFFGVLVGAWVARYLGPDAYGEVAYALAYLAFFQVAVSLGLDGIVVRELSKYPTQGGRILGTVFFMRLGVGIFSWILSVGGLMVVNGWQDKSVLLVLIAGSALIFQPADTIDLWFQSQSQSRRTVIAKSSAYVISNGIRVVLLLCQASLIWFVLVVAIDAMIAAVALAFIYRQSKSNVRWLWSSNLAKTLLAETWPYAVSSLAVMVYMRFDQILIRGILGSKDLGLYAAMLPLSTVWNMLPTVICTSVAPLIARKKAENESEYYKVLLFVFRSFLVASLSLSVVIAMLSPLIVKTLYGSAYMGSSKILAIHIFTNVPVFLGVAQSLWFTNENRAGVMLRNTLLGGCVALVANYYLLPILGVEGAAISAVLSFFTSGVLLNVFGAREVFLMQIGIDVRKFK